MTVLYEDVKALDLGKEFHRLIRESLDPSDLREVDRRNRTSAYDGCCATHDFFDANEVMHEAFSNVTGSTDNDDIVDYVTNTKTGNTVWSEAWAYARINGFSNEWRA